MAKNRLYWECPDCGKKTPRHPDTSEREANGPDGIWCVWCGHRTIWKAGEYPLEEAKREDRV